MILDLATLVVVSVFVTALLGALLVFSWWQNREIRALGWWGASFLMGSVGAGGLAAGLLGRTLSPGAVPTLAHGLLLAAYGVFWLGFRTFYGRTASPLAIMAGALLWFAACGIPGVYRSIDARVLLPSIGAGAYCLAAAFETWRASRERLLSRLPLVILLVLHAGMVLARYPSLALWGIPGGAVAPNGAWIAVHVFETVLFVVASAFLLVALAKERAEAEQRGIAARDPLTGLLNRRAFFERARLAVERARRDGRACALVVADLDHFKQVNDRFGHAAGDDVLRGFAKAAKGAAPGDAILARLGGEEFVCLLPGHDAAAALSFAEGVRASFAAIRFDADHDLFGATVSLGVATVDDAGYVLDALLTTADVMLYSAKDEGRNRVQHLGRESPATASRCEPLAMAA